MKTHRRILYALGATALTALHIGTFNAEAALVSANTITNDDNVIGLFFDVPVTLPSATNPANYAVYAKTGVVSIASVTLQTNNQLVALNLATNIGEFYYLSVSNVVDAATNSISRDLVGYISDYDSGDIGTPGDPDPTGSVFTPHRSSFDVTVGGSDIGGTEDHCRFIYQPVIGDFDMAAQVTRLDLADPLSKAGLMARESLAPGSPSLQVYFTPTGGSNEIEVSVRATNNGVASDTGFQIGPRPSADPLRWLRLTRTNDLFTAYHSTNGLDWTVNGSTTQAFSTTLNIGMAVASHTTNSTPTTASFTSFGIKAARPGDDVVPTLSATLNGTNVDFSWLRTPRDYSVEISTNLVNWSLLLAPIFEFGTNNNGYVMPVAPGEFGSPLYARLVRVERLIPDPVVLTTGVIISLGTGNATAGSDSLLCTLQVTNAIVQTAMTAPPNKTIKFSTGTSDPILDTVLQVRRFSTPVYCNDNSLGIKSLVTHVSTTTKTNFSLISAVKPATPTSPTKQIIITIEVQ